MQALTVVLLQGDAGVAQSLVSALSQGFSSVQQVRSLGELRNRIAKTRAEVAILDIESASLSEVEHLSQDFFAACDGNPPGRHCKMDGWDKEVIDGLRTPPNPEFGYVPANESAPYFAMAHSYVLADKMFASQIDASFVSHQYIIAGQSQGAVDLPNGQWGCGGGGSDLVSTLNQDRTYGSPVAPCFDSQTLGDELDAKKLSWRYYAASQVDLWEPYLERA